MSVIKIKDIEEKIKELPLEEAIKELKLYESTYGDRLKKLLEKYEKKNAAHQKELCRYQLMCKYEEQAFKNGLRLIAGIDEVGRGPLAGPVVASAVILPEGVFIEKLNDSKKLSAKQRDEIYEDIKKKALYIGIGIVDEKTIDEINILNATRRAMGLAFENLGERPQLVLVDAEKLRDVEVAQIPIIKGDTLSISIAAASIVAKVTRDAMLDDLDKQYPQYGFMKHKGYGTKEHIDAIKKFGICPIHRVSFTKNFVASGK